MAGITESQRIVLNWKARLKAAGWSEELQRQIVSDLCEAGYRQCIVDIKAHDQKKEMIIHAATGGAIN